MSTATEVHHQFRQSRHRTYVRALKVLNRNAPLLTILVAAISFVGGIAFNALNAREKAAEIKVEQWRLALEKVAFDEVNLLPTAYLMDSFRADSTYHDQARAIEAEALVRTNDPHKFDLMFAIMLRHTSIADQVDLIRMARTLSLELKGLYSLSASKNNLSFGQFLMNPQEAFAPNSSAHNRTLVLLWEIDSISKGFQCSWWTHAPRCAPLSAPEHEDLSNIMLFNHPLPSSVMNNIPESSRPKSYDTCTVGDLNTTPQTPGLTCQTPRGSEGAR
jgi:hypothetical protein